MTKRNTYVTRKRGKRYEGCVTCRRATQIRYRRNKGILPRMTEPRSTPTKLQAARELLRTKVYAMPDCEYRTKMLEAFAAFDAHEAMDKRPARFGRKFPQQKVKPAKRQKAA